MLPAALAFGGCGASDSRDADDVAAAATRTVAAGSSRMEAVGESEDETVRIEGAIDYAARRASFTFEVESRDEDDRESGEFRYVGDTAYVDSTFLGLAGTGVESKRWLAMDLRENEASLDSLLLPFPFIDPAHTLELLLDVSHEVEQAGEEDVRGVATEHYRLTIDLERVVEEAPARLRSRLRRELDAASEKTRRLELWIDGEGLVRRLSVPDSDEKVTIDFFDFGVDVDVEAPPADEVATMPDLVPERSTEYGPTDDDEEGK